jgi:hypothetical protein
VYAKQNHSVFEAKVVCIFVAKLLCISMTVIAGELEGNRRDCNTMEKQRGRRGVYYKCCLSSAKRNSSLPFRRGPDLSIYHIPSALLVTYVPGLQP